MNYTEWEASVPVTITGDALWGVTAYRLSLFMADIGWTDVTKLMHDPRTRSLADQLFRALGSISANIAEGYSKGTGKDRARFYEYALGSARESRDWYFKARYVLGDEVINHRLHELTRIIQLLLTMVTDQRAKTLRDEEGQYATD
jgi:four helix bundle protein